MRFDSRLADTILSLYLFLFNGEKAKEIMENSFDSSPGITDILDPLEIVPHSLNYDLKKELKTRGERLENETQAKIIELIS